MNRVNRDDITALCSHARMDEGVYRVFPPASGNQARTYPSEITARQRDTLQPGSRAVQPRAEEARNSRAISILDASNSATKSGREGLPAKASITCWHSASGGTGKTTVLATLARIYSLSGKNVVLMDESPQTLLPFYFGGRPQAGRGSRFAALQEAHNGSVQIVRRENEQAGWLAKGLADFSSSVDHILVDSCPVMLQDPALAAAEPASIVVLACDMSSALTVRHTLATFKEQEGRIGSPLFVLNRFDSASALHDEIRTWMTRQLGDRLLPTTIRRAEETAEAMAEGLTVIDFAPNSPVAQDFLALAETLQQLVRPAAEGSFSANALYR